MLLHLIREEDQVEAEMIATELENAHRSRVFAADIPNRWAIFSELFKEPDPAEEEFGGPITEATPEDERELQKMITEMKRSGITFAE